MGSRKEYTINKNSGYKNSSPSCPEFTHPDVELVAESSWTASVQLFSRFDLFNQLGVHRVFDHAFEHLQMTLFFKFDLICKPSRAHIIYSWVQKQSL